MGKHLPARGLGLAVLFSPEDLCWVPPVHPTAYKRWRWTEVRWQGLYHSWGTGAGQAVTPWLGGYGGFLALAYCTQASAQSLGCPSLSRVPRTQTLLPALLPPALQNMACVKGALPGGSGWCAPAPAGGRWRWPILPVLVPSVRVIHLLPAAPVEQSKLADLGALHTPAEPVLPLWHSQALVPLLAAEAMAAPLQANEVEVGVPRSQGWQ